MTAPAKTISDQTRTHSSAVSTPGLQDWALTPEGKLAGNPDGSLALGMEPVGALNGSEQAQAEAGELFKLIIDPIINSTRYPEMHRAYPRRADLVANLAKQNNKSSRTVYRLLKAWQTNGITALARHVRVDKGKSRLGRLARVDQ